MVHPYNINTNSTSTAVYTYDMYSYILSEVCRSGPGRTLNRYIHIYIIHVPGMYINMCPSLQTPQRCGWCFGGSIEFLLRLPWSLHGRKHTHTHTTHQQNTNHTRVSMVHGPFFFPRVLSRGNIKVPEGWWMMDTFRVVFCNWCVYFDEPPPPFFHSTTRNVYLYFYRNLILRKK